MIKKINLLALSASLLLAVSCMNSEKASDKIDANATEIPPASPDAIIAPEPNISAAPPTTEQAPAAPPANGKFAEMTFSKTEHDFGKIKEGDNATYVFSFENTGDSDLIISDAKGSCGCTVPEYPKEPIAPGAKGKIKVSFNSSGKPGNQHKTVTITANTKTGREKLDIKATVEPKA